MMVDKESICGILRKQATSVAERSRLASEAAILRAGAHPGVVQILGSEGASEPEVLELRKVDGKTLGERSPLDPADMVWIGAALATTVADLHDIGITHGAIEPDHVLIDERDRPILCGFGSARRASGASDFANARRADVAALANLLIGASRDVPGPRVSAALRAAASGRRRTGWRGNAVDARSLARILGAAAPSTRFPVSVSKLRGNPARRKRSAIEGAVLAVVATAVLYATVGSAGVGGAHRGVAGNRFRDSGATPAPCPRQDDGCGALPATAGIIGGRFRILGVAGATVLGRWNCSSDSTPAVLDKASDNVWIFDSWPGSHQQVVARLVATVPLASTLKVSPSPGAGTPGCDRIEVERSGRAPILIDPRRK